MDIIDNEVKVDGESVVTETIDNDVEVERLNDRNSYVMDVIDNDVKGDGDLL